MGVFLTFRAATFAFARKGRVLTSSFARVFFPSSGAIKTPRVAPAKIPRMKPPRCPSFLSDSGLFFFIFFLLFWTVTITQGINQLNSLRQTHQETRRLHKRFRERLKHMIRRLQHGIDALGSFTHFLENEDDIKTHKKEIQGEEENDN